MTKGGDAERMKRAINPPATAGNPLLDPNRFHVGMRFTQKNGPGFKIVGITDLLVATDAEEPEIKWYTKEYIQEGIDRGEVTSING